ncbi:hypothetical protein [Arthrobacter sp. B6]|uniref:hypothetical protein n=1 Tax=Arthrobacter sp. B6 TaxID=1570137 RepID=UPI00082A6C4B|nr:hypothetical protein [Arthrobacter sp. B6]
MDQLSEVPGDRTASRFAYAAAVTGAIGVVTLGAMYAVEVPRGGPYVFGTINDATGAVFNVLVIPVILQVHRRVPPAPGTEPMKWITVSACAAGAASSALLVFKVLDFNSSTAISIAAITVQGAWFFLIHGRLRKVEEYPRSLSRLGRFIGGAMLVGLPAAGAGYALQGPEWLRMALMGAGITVGAAAWLAWPYWYFRAGQYFGHRLHRGATPATPKPGVKG